MTYLLVRRTECLRHAYLFVFLCFVCPLFGESGTLARFVAPSYPPLARQAMISGTVSLTLSVSSDGSVIDIKVNSSGHPLLAQEAESTVRQWSFHPWLRQRSVSVMMYFGFSGDTREVNPRTVIKAELYQSTIRVFVTTDGAPAVRP